MSCNCLGVDLSAGGAPAVDGQGQMWAPVAGGGPDEH